LCSFSMRPVAQDGGGVNEIFVRGDFDVVSVALY
jgi:hypothetical protein